jgi:hypothetical protein
MAYEPERPIEKLLRAAARKRRDDAGVPFELHPADRRLLQAEVAQRFAKPRRESRSFAELLGQFWPRFAGGLAILAVLGLAVWALLPLPRNDRTEALLAKNLPAAKDMLAVETPPMTARAPATVAPPLAPTAKTEPATVAYADTSAPGLANAARPLGAVPSPIGEGSTVVQLKRKDADKLALLAAPKPADQQEPAVPLLATSRDTLAQAPTAFADGAFDRRYGSAGQPVPPASLPATPAAPSIVAMTPTTASAPRVEDASQQAKALSVAQRFVQVSPEARAENSLADSAATAHPVLASFQVEQSGQTLRIVDGDGSVYTGSVQLANAPRRTRSAKVDAPAASFGVRMAARSLEQETPASLDSNVLTPQTYSFRVAGTNRSLQQKVVFTGNLLTATNLILSPPGITNLSIGSSLGGSRYSTAQSDSLLPLNSRISGKVVIGRGKAVEINALPAGP